MFSIYKLIRIISVALLFVGCTLQATAQAPNSAGFPATVKVENTTLQLNGSGTRYKAIFKVYDMAFYATKKVTTSADAINLEGAKYLQFKALRELPGTDLGLLFIRGMKDNSPPDAIIRHTGSTNRLIEVFSGRKKLLTGETFAMEYLPGKGTVFYIENKPQGAPIGDAEFFAMVLKIWLGQIPADFLLKDALLGIGK